MTSMEKIDQSRALLEQLCTHFDLSHEPFAPASSFFYGGGQREHVLESLRHLAIFGDQVLFLTGGKGAGKTKIIDEFIRRHAEEIDVVSLAAGAGQSGETSIHRFALLSDVPVVKGEPARQTLQRLVQKFDQVHLTTGQRTLLVIDDADLLPKEELRLYVTVFRDLPPETGAVLLLVGSEELLDAAVAGSNIARDEWFHQIPLKHLSSEEVVAYLQGWLEACGYRGHLNLGESQATHLVEMGRGMPGRINRLFPGLVLGAQAPEPAPRVRIGLSPQAMMLLVGGVFVLCFVAVASRYQWFSTTEKSPESVTGVVLDAPESTATEPDADTEARLQSIDAAMKSLEQSEPVEALDAVPEPLQAEVPPSVPMQEVVIQKAPVEVPPVPQEPVPLEVVQPEPEPVPDVEPEAIVQTPEPKAELPRVEQPVQEKAPEPAPALKVAPVVPAEAEPVAGFAPGAQRPADWVRSQAPKAYTAQVLASVSEDAVRKFISSNKDARAELYYIKTRLKGKDWFVVLYGVYPNRSAATAAMAKAPKKIRDQTPWLRSFDSLSSALP